MTATTSANLPVSYASSDTSVVTVNGTMLRIVGAGSATITASQKWKRAVARISRVPKTVTVWTSMSYRSADHLRKPTCRHHLRRIRRNRSGCQYNLTYHLVSGAGGGEEFPVLDR